MKGNKSKRDWSSLAHESTQTPGYWTNLPSSKSVTEVFQTVPSKNRVEIVRVDSATEKAITKMVQGTWDQSIVGQGRDAVGLHHSRIKIRKIERIENLDLFAKYASKRQEFFRTLSDSGKPSFPSLKDLQVQNQGNVRTQAHLSSPLGDELYPEINECYVFHGTKPDVIKAVIRQGLDYRMSSDKAMFGMGIYGAECSTKADQYAGIAYIHIRTDASLKVHRIYNSVNMVLKRRSLVHSFEILVA